MMRRSSKLLLAGSLAGSLLVSGAAAEGQGWHELEKKEGVTTSEKAAPGRTLPTYRGQTEVEGPVLQVLAVVLDDARSKEWAKDVAEAQVLRRIDAKTEIVYSRSKQTWPVKDRDLVMKRTVQVLKPGEEFRVRLTCVNGEKPEVSRVVRIKQCDTTFLLRKLSDRKTYVEMLMDVDPGGHHPEWAVRMATKSVPYETLSALRKQVRRTEGLYKDELSRWAN